MTSSIYFNSGNAGIGNNTPVVPLDISGNLNLSGNMDMTMNMGVVLDGLNNNLVGLNAGFYARPVRDASVVDGFNQATAYTLFYDASNNEIGYGGTNLVDSGLNKTFVIDHPLDEDKYLVHGCLEGPEAGVYYHGKGEITNGTDTIVTLPSYVSALAQDFSIQITLIHDEANPIKSYYEVSDVEDNQFRVFGENGEFFWMVYGLRSELEVEPKKLDTVIDGDGPYKWTLK